ncbi:hypothetical protein F2Q69_00036701 [Brassica cretica]|uniref:Uncharacterized protein n=1 Tax=Brassica cretica TaxID=69181 RepID=A0A8S9SMN2_BRACR|nr:hypothetical protein F2Q69_00036701 [Brassica cretica]
MKLQQLEKRRRMTNETGRTSTSTDATTSTSTDITTSTSIDVTTSSSIDDVDREVTMEDSLELEEWLEDMDQNSKKKLDDDQHTSRGDLETSKASIGRLQPDEIDRQPPHIIDLHPPDIDRHYQPLIDRRHPPNIDRCPLLDVPPGCIIEMDPIKERMYMFKASHLAVPKHQRPPFWTEEAAGFHKRVKRIHDPVKIVVPCAVFEAVSPIPPDRSMQFSSHIEEFDVCGNLRDGETSTRSNKSGRKKRGNWKKRKRIKDSSQFLLIPCFSDGVRKPRVRSRYFSQPFAQIRALLIAEMIDKGEESMEEAFTQE